MPVHLGYRKRELPTCEFVKLDRGGEEIVQHRFMYYVLDILLTSKPENGWRLFGRLSQFHHLPQVCLYFRRIFRTFIDLEYFVLKSLVSWVYIYCLRPTLSEKHNNIVNRNKSPWFACFSTSVIRHVKDTPVFPVGQHWGISVRVLTITLDV